MLHMSTDEYKQYLAQRGRETAPQRAKRPPKYRNKRVYVYEDGFAATQKRDGHGKVVQKYDSIKEYQRHQELMMLERVGAISGLRTQVPFEIQPGFVDSNGGKHRAIVYRADFVYLKEGREVVEDVKGYSKAKRRYICTEAFKLKWKILQAKYPEKVFVLF